MPEHPAKNQNSILHENVDCRIMWNENHQLGIDVAGTVSFRDPIEWHRMATRIRELEYAIVKCRREFRKGSDPVDARACLFRVTVDEDRVPNE